MARKKIVPVVEDQLQVVELDFNGLFPFCLRLVYKKGTSIEKIVHEAAGKDENLLPLSYSFGEDGRSPLSLVYQNVGTTVAYMFLDDHITIDTIVHESDHVTFRLFEIVGSEINEHTEEFFSYIDTNIFKRVCQIVTGTFSLNPPLFYEEI